MSFEVLKRNGTARSGVLEINGSIIETPHILWYASERIKPPEFAKVMLSQKEPQKEHAISHQGSVFLPKKSMGLSFPPLFIYPHVFPQPLHHVAMKWNLDHASLFQIISSKNLDGISPDPLVYIMANARELFSNSREFVNAVVTIREKIGYHKALYAPGIGEPSTIALLSYLTIDLFDSLTAIEKARKNIFLFPEGDHTCESDGETPCHCPACVKDTQRFDDILFHNYYALQDELQKIKHAIKKGEIREFTERRICNRPGLLSCLRILDSEHYEFQEKKYAVTGKKIRVSCVSLTRPDIERFRRRLQEHYVKPPSATIALLLPCSAKKPYSFSQSHTHFKRVLNTCRNRHVIHEIIVTSPLGIVPRELEILYPAAHYDISVTGQWSHDEKEIVKRCLSSYLLQNKYDAVINHLPPDITDFIDIGEKTCSDHPLTSTALSLLAKTLKEIVKNYSLVAPSKRKYEDVVSLLSYQFGKDIAPTLMKGCTVKGRYPYYKLFSKEKQIASVSPRGLASLTLEGGQRLAHTGAYTVEIDDFIPHGTVFSVGVHSADRGIRKGDEVVVRHGDDVRAVGVALTDGEEMQRSTRGRAVRVRHHKS